MAKRPPRVEPSVQCPFCAEEVPLYRRSHKVAERREKGGGATVLAYAWTHERCMTCGARVSGYVIGERHRPNGAARKRR